MVKRHLKLIAAPKTWPVNRKKNVWIMRPNPGSHKMELSLPIKIILIDILLYAKNLKEVKNILNQGLILINGKKTKDKKASAGLFDVISIEKTKENFRIVLNKKGKLLLTKIDEKQSKIKPCKIISKKFVKGKLYVHTSDGRTFKVDKDEFKISDTIITEIPKQKITKIIKFEPGALVFIDGGKNIAKTGTIKEIKDNNIILESNKETLKTSKKHAFVIGKEKAEIKLE